MGLIKRLCNWWQFRDRSREHLEEEFLILLKSARRCAYDLNHAIDWIPRDHWAKEMFKDRARRWLSIFSPDGVKDYRLQLHFELDRLEREVERLQQLILAQSKGDAPKQESNADHDDVPF